MAAGGNDDDDDGDDGADLPYVFRRKYMLGLFGYSVRTPPQLRIFCKAADAENEGAVNPSLLRRIVDSHAL